MSHRMSASSNILALEVSSEERQLTNISITSEAVMDSIGKDCKELKRQYEICFNAWYSENFLKNKNGDISVCEPLFQEYQKCLKEAIKRNKIPLWELDGEMLHGSEKKATDSGTST